LRSSFTDFSQFGLNMKSSVKAFLGVSLVCLVSGLAHASSYGDTIVRFKNSDQTANFFRTCYGYAVFPTVGEGAIGVGGAFGKGRVYVHGAYVGNVSMGEISVGFQAGGQGFSQIIFFEDKRALNEFEASGFEFGADVGAVAITAGASATASTNGASAGASVDANNAVTRGRYQKGMAVFTIAKGGLMYQAAVAGQKFHYTPRGS
jgi:lipid-binding SYLF domain-containing protein